MNYLRYNVSDKDVCAIYNSMNKGKKAPHITIQYNKDTTQDVIESIRPGLFVITDTALWHYGGEWSVVYKCACPMLEDIHDVGIEKSTFHVTMFSTTNESTAKSKYKKLPDFRGKMLFFTKEKFEIVEL